VRVTERLYRWVNWQIVDKSHDYMKPIRKQSSFA